MQSLELRRGSKQYGPRRVLQELNLSIQAGDRLVILGPSGAGKTTLLNILAGLDTLDSGQVLADGQDVAEFSPDLAAAWRNRQVGFVYQRHCLLPQFSLLENILVPVLERGPARQAAVDKAQAWIARAGLAERALAHPQQVSAGESQRAAILRALINEPALLLADEPTGSLDQATALATLDFLLERQAATGCALVLVTHDTAIAHRAAHGDQDRILHLQDGILHAPA